MNVEQIRSVVGQAIGNSLLALEDRSILGVAFVIITIEGTEATTTGGVAAAPGVAPELLSALALNYFVEAAEQGKTFEAPTRIKAGGGS